MIYLFEDRFEDPLSKLFCAGYDKSVCQHFIYANGCGNLAAVLDKTLADHPEEQILVFMDMVPDNRELVPIYKNLRHRYYTSNGRAIVLPIVCSEYYFIRSIQNSRVVTDKSSLTICTGIKPWKESALLESDADRMFCKNFERFCKLFLLKAVKDCAKHSRGNAASENSSYGDYYTKDCRCATCDMGGGSHTLQRKAYYYVRGFPCFPAGLACAKELALFDRQALLNLNRKLCQAHDKKRKEFMNAGLRTPMSKLTPIEPTMPELKEEH